MMCADLARHLAKEALRAMEALAIEERGDDAALFIDSVVRLRAAPRSTIESAGLATLVREAQTALRAEAPRLAALAARSLDFVDLEARAAAIARGTPQVDDDAESWCEDVLLVGSVLGELGVGKLRSELEGAVEQCGAFLLSDPRAFSGAAHRVADRREQGDVGSFDDPCVATFVQACSDLWLEAADVSVPVPPDAAARARLEEILANAGDDLVGAASLEFVQQLDWQADRERRARPELRALPTSHAAGAVVGNVQLLLWDPETGRATARQLSVRHEPGARLWSGSDERWGSVAWDAIRTAWSAAGSLLPCGRALHGLLDHRIQLVGQERIDGDSLALPLGLAFLSLWTDKALPGGTAATGALDRSGRVGPVGGIAEKRAAWLEALQGSDGPFLVPTGQERASGPEVGVATLAHAASAVGLDPASCAAVPDDGDEDHRLAHLRRWVADVDNQSLDTHQVPGVDPWAVVAQRLLSVAESLDPDGPYSEDLARARVAAATAWLHGGIPEESGTALGVLERSEDALPAPLRVLVLTARLNRQIDEPSTDAESIDASLAEAMAAPSHGGREWDVALLWATGTRGRFRLHRRELDRALPLIEQCLERAVRSHPREVARCRNTLAMALRTAGRPDEALVAIDQASRELESRTRVASWSYYLQTRTFIRYERARIMLDQGRAKEAERVAREALEELVPLGPWPQIGILRTQAWALRALGRAGAAEACVARIAGLLPSTGPLAVFRRIAEEAEGEWRLDGEVY